MHPHLMNELRPIDLTAIPVRPKRPRVRGRHIEMNRYYFVELSRCDTHAKIVDWVLHLSQKSWVTPDLLRRFILLATTYNKVKLDRNA